MGFLSDQPTTASITGGYLHEILPDAGSATGYTSYRILTSNVLAAVNSSISDLSDALDLLEARVVLIENIVGVENYNLVTDNQQWSQEEGWVLEKIIAKSAGPATIKIGTTAGDEDVLASQSLTAMTPYKKDFGSEGMNLYLDPRTLYITITGTVSFNLYYSNNFNLI